MNKQFEKRIQDHPTCKAVDLNPTEMPLYRGCGHAIAAVRGDSIVAVYYVGQHFYDGDSADDVLMRCKADNANRHADFLMVGMMSCSQFCEPTVIDFDNGSGIAYLKQAIAEMVDDYE